MIRSVIALFLLCFLSLPVNAETTMQAGDDAGRVLSPEYREMNRDKRQADLEKRRAEYEKKRAERVKQHELRRAQKREHDRKTPGTAASQEAIQYDSAVTVNYDRASDHLSITAKDASLKSVLGRIAKLSGVEVLFDDAADGPLSIDFKNESLDNGLKQILKGRNSSLRYSEDSKKHTLLVGVTVLPVGEQGSGNARQLVGMDDEAYYRARSKLSNEQLTEIDNANERWQARLNQLPPKQRAIMEKKVNDRLLKQAQDDQKHAQDVAKRKQRRAERLAKKQAFEKKQLQSLTPEQRADFEQRGAKAREQVRLQILKSANAN